MVVRLSLLLLGVASFLPMSAPSVGVGKEQSVAVKGILMCKEQPAYKVEVKLYDEDFGKHRLVYSCQHNASSGVDLDDLLDSGYTNAYGEFQLQGSTHEFMNIDPKINIYHDCDDGAVGGEQMPT